jgi:hypothetical protein
VATGTSLRRLWSMARSLGRWALALVILFEEWGWTPLARGLGRLASRVHLQRLEQRVSRLGPRLALAVLFVPALALLPVKIGALWLLGLGRVALGLAVLVVAKILGTALVARLFLLTRPQLMQLSWFARWHGRWTAWKTRVVESLVATPGWRGAQSLAARVRALWAAR